MNIKRHKDYQKIVVSFAKTLEQKLKIAKPSNKKEATIILENLFQNEVATKFAAHCAQYKMIKCDNEVKYWNNARLSHYLTYDEHENELKIWLINKKLSAKALLEYLHSRYYHFKESKNQLSFWEFLRSEE